MKKALYPVSLGTFFLALGVLSCFARPVPKQSYNQLLAASDLVAIVEPIENQPAKDDFLDVPYGPRSAYDATNTRFRVQCLLKGGESAPGGLTVLHFSYSKQAGMVVDGATFIIFQIGPLQYEKRSLKDEKPIGSASSFFDEHPTWLAFLKRRTDGRFEPVTGQYDAGNSFRELHEASFF